MSNIPHSTNYETKKNVCELLPPANEVWGNVMFLHVSVILLTGGVPWQYSPPRAGTPLAGTPPGRYTPWQVHPQQVHIPGQVHPQQVHPPGQVPSPSRYPPGNACLDMVNKRAACILLECILVITIYSKLTANLPILLSDIKARRVREVPLQNEYWSYVNFWGEICKRLHGADDGKILDPPRQW